MAQGSKKLAKRPRSGSRAATSKSRKIGKGTRVFKPKKTSLAVAHNKNKKLTAAIARNIEKETSACLNRNGGKLSLLKKVDDAVKKGGDEASSNAKAPKFNTKKQFRLTS